MLNRKPKYRIVQNSYECYELQRKGIFGWRDLKLQVLEYNAIAKGYYEQRKDSWSCCRIEEAERNLKLYRKYPVRHKGHKIKLGFYRSEPMFYDASEAHTSDIDSWHEFYRYADSDFDMLIAEINGLIREREERQRKPEARVIKEYY